MSREQLEEIVEIARGVGAYILCDEVYRHLTQGGQLERVHRRPL